MAELLETLKANPGLYVGKQTSLHEGQEIAGTSRMVVTVLPGNAGVALDYEVTTPGGELAHREHAVLAASVGGLVLVTAHDHAEVVTVLREEASDRGSFTVPAAEAPFPSAIRIEAPEPGHLVYSWSYGWADQPLQVRDVGDLRRVR